MESMTDILYVHLYMPIIYLAIRLKVFVVPLE